jgi:hypothetical protein
MGFDGVESLMRVINECRLQNVGDRHQRGIPSVNREHLKV